MDFASSPISVEKNRVGAGAAWAPKKLDRCDVKHEIVAFILTGIRNGVAKRRKGEELREQWGGGTPPAILHQYQRKGVIEFAFRKSLILKGAILVVLD